MNWPRARLWLIVAFLCLDVLLAGMLLSGAGVPYRWQQPSTRALTGHLARFGLELQAALPAPPETLSLQRLEGVAVSEWLLPKLYPAGIPVPEAARTASGGTQLIYRTDEAITILEPGGRVTVYYVEIMTQPESGNEPMDSAGVGSDTVEAGGTDDSAAAAVGSADNALPAAAGANAAAVGASTGTVGSGTAAAGSGSASGAGSLPGAGNPPGTGSISGTGSAPAAGGASGGAERSYEQVTAALLRTAEEWAFAWGGLPDGADEAIVAYDPVTGLGTVAWRPAIGGWPLYGSQLRVTLVPMPDGEFAVGHWERRWFRALGPVGEPRPAVPAQTALLRLAGHLESIGAPGGTITGVTLGYYTGEYQADAWEVPPVWRLDLADRRFFYVNALTGELESD